MCAVAASFSFVCILLVFYFWKDFQRRGIRLLLTSVNPFLFLIHCSKVQQVVEFNLMKEKISTRFFGFFFCSNPFFFLFFLQWIIQSLFSFKKNIFSELWIFFFAGNNFRSIMLVDVFFLRGKYNQFSKEKIFLHWERSCFEMKRQRWDCFFTGTQKLREFPFVVFNLGCLLFFNWIVN